MSITFLTYAFYESATVPAVYVHPHGTRKVRNSLMTSRKDDAPTPTKYVWNTIFPNIAKKNIKKPYRNHFELIHRGIGLFLEHFKSPSSLLKSWPRPHKWLQKNLFSPNIAIPNGTRVSALGRSLFSIIRNNCLCILFYNKVSCSDGYTTNIDFLASLQSSGISSPATRSHSPFLNALAIDTPIFYLKFY